MRFGLHCVPPQYVCTQSKKMNNYLTAAGESEEERLRREQLQERHYKIFNNLKVMASELPINYQQRLPYELLSSLANCLLDDTIVQIVLGLKEIQKILEKSLYEKRQRTIDHLKASKQDLQRRNKEAIQLRTMNQEQASKKELEMDKYVNDEIKKLDARIVDELDQCLKEQQETLRNASVPHFFVTDKPIEVRLQMFVPPIMIKLDNHSNHNNHFPVISGIFWTSFCVFSDLRSLVYLSLFLLLFLFDTPNKKVRFSGPEPPGLNRCSPSLSTRSPASAAPLRPA